MRPWIGLRARLLILVLDDPDPSQPCFLTLVPIPWPGQRLSMASGTDGTSCRDGLAGNAETQGFSRQTNCEMPWRDGQQLPDTSTWLLRLESSREPSLLNL